MTKEILDRASEIAKEEMARLEKEEKASEQAQKQEEEAKGASVETPEESQEEQKTVGQEAGEEKPVEKTDEQIMEADNESLNEDELARKNDLIEKEEEALSTEAKIARIKEKTQKRIDQLTAELKGEKESRTEDKQKIEYLESELSNLRQSLEESGSIEKPQDKVEATLEANIAKRQEEDKDLPFAERREMSDDDLEQFLLEDMVGAQKWLARRELRHDKERTNLANSHKAVGDIQAKTKAFYDKFPGCNQEARHRELLSQGKTSQEAMDIICKESPEFKTMIDIFREKPELADVNNPDAPELTTKEMEKRLEKTTPRMYSEEELEAAKQEAIKAEQERQANIDTAVTNSNQANRSPSEYEKQPWFSEGLKLYIKAGELKGEKLTKQDYIETLRYGKDQRGSDSSI